MRRPLILHITITSCERVPYIQHNNILPLYAREKKYQVISVEQRMLMKYDTNDNLTLKIRYRNKSKKTNLNVYNTCKNLK